MSLANWKPWGSLFVFKACTHFEGLAVKVVMNNTQNSRLWVFSNCKKFVQLLFEDFEKVLPGFDQCLPEKRSVVPLLFSVEYYELSETIVKIVGEHYLWADLFHNQFCNGVTCYNGLYFKKPKYDHKFLPNSRHFEVLCHIYFRHLCGKYSVAKRKS